MNNIRLGVVMDPIGQITPAKDSTLAMLLEAKVRGYDIQYFEQADLRLVDGEPRGLGRTLSVADDPTSWYDLDTAVDHVPDRVTAATADSQYLDDSVLTVSIH